MNVSYASMHVNIKITWLSWYNLIICCILRKKNRFGFTRCMQIGQSLFNQTICRLLYHHLSQPYMITGTTAVSIARFVSRCYLAMFLSFSSPLLPRLILQDSVANNYLLLSQRNFDLRCDPFLLQVTALQPVILRCSRALLLSVCFLCLILLTYVARTFQSPIIITVFQVLITSHEDAVLPCTYKAKK